MADKINQKTKEGGFAPVAKNTKTPLFKRESFMVAKKQENWFRYSFCHQEPCLPARFARA
ncbi:MAG: hypothetical protein Q7S36_01085 [Candidatus Liptonbacteria bacterium]|nr:hypothetical protein [Candidatus Liptonbacteria bacterium]